MSMDIKGKVHCFFEQSGTFKNEFRKLGYEAYDYDIQNNFGETDHVVDLFAEIEKAYEGGASLFDRMTPDDLILAFFPCIYFSDMSEILMTWGGYPSRTPEEATKAILDRAEKRHLFYQRIVKMFTVAKSRGLRMVVENPWGSHSFLQRGFITEPAFIDKDRSLRGDYYAKPTAYWFINCEPTHGMTICRLHTPKSVKKSHHDHHNVGVCNMDRSAISPDYARLFICDFIIGKPQPFTQLQLFE